MKPQNHIESQASENTLGPFSAFRYGFCFGIIEKDIHCSQYILVFTICSLLQAVKLLDSNFEQIILNQKKRFQIKCRVESHHKIPRNFLILLYHRRND